MTRPVTVAGSPEGVVEGVGGLVAGDPEGAPALGRPQEVSTSARTNGALRAMRPGRMWGYYYHLEVFSMTSRLLTVTLDRGPLLLLFALGNRTSELMRAHFADAPLTASDFGVTSALRLLQPTRPSELATAVGLRPTSMSNYLRRLTERGLIERVTDPTDGRAALVSLTPRGLEQTIACFPHFQASLRAFEDTAVAMGEDLQDLAAVLNRLDRVLTAARLGAPDDTAEAPQPS